MSQLVLKTGEYIHYGAHGVCQITDIVSRMVGRKREKFFLLRPASDENIELLLPIDSEPERVKIRRVMTAEEIKNLVDSEMNQPIKWISDSKLRRESLSKVMRDGDAAELIRVVKSMHAREMALPEGKSLPMSDMEFAKQAEKQLYNEFHFVLSIPKEQVIPFILGDYNISICD